MNEKKNKRKSKGCDFMNIRLILTGLMLLSVLAFAGCAGYAAYGYDDYPYYYDYGYPYGSFSFHHDFDGHHFEHGGYEGHHEGRGR